MKEGICPEKYIPRPLETEDVKLPAEILQLSERLAENIHENWSALRIAQDWTYGPRRDDEKKQHPGLVPYSQLDESEKDFDRQTALETLKTIMKLGYRIERSDR